MINKRVVSNIRFPEDEWIQLKSAAYSMGISVNEYIRFLFHTESIKSMTGVKTSKFKKSGYEAMGAFINRQRKGKPMGASEDDKIIYGI